MKTLVQSVDSHYPMRKLHVISRGTSLAGRIYLASGSWIIQSKYSKALSLGCSKLKTRHIIGSYLTDRAYSPDLLTLSLIRKVPSLLLFNSCAASGLSFLPANLAR